MAYWSFIRIRYEVEDDVRIDYKKVIYHIMKLPLINWLTKYLGNFTVY